MQRKLILKVFILLLTVPVFGQFKNVKLDTKGEGVYPLFEPSIVVSPKNPKNIVAGAGPDKVYLSIDGGLTWTTSQLESKYGVQGNPVLAADDKGNFYYAHLSDPSAESETSEVGSDRIVVQKSLNGGKKWDGGMGVGLNPPKNQDKPGIAINPKNGTVYLTYTQFDKYGSADTGCESNIMFSQLKWGKGRWTKPVKLNQHAGNCLDGNTAVGRAAPGVGVDGKVYVAWSWNERIYFDRSMDGGEFWLSTDLIIIDQPGSLDIKIPGVMRTNSFPALKVDNSKGPFRGNVYLMWSDQKNAANDTDVWVMKSGNGGDNWTPPVRVNNDDAGKHQFFPAMSIDPATGVVYILFYDRRAYDDNRTDVYLAYSTDGGTKFKNIKISESPFVPEEDKFLGGNIGLSAMNGTIAAIWTRMDDGETSVWTSIIKDTEVVEELKQYQDDGKKKKNKKKKEK